MVYLDFSGCSISLYFFGENSEIGILRPVLRVALHIRPESRMSRKVPYITCSEINSPQNINTSEPKYRPKMTKVIAVTGATGKQGGSVARVMLQTQGWTVSRRNKAVVR